MKGVLGFIGLVVVGTCGSAAASPGHLVLETHPQEPVVVSTNQTVTPVGVVRSIEGDRPKDLTLSPDGNTLAVLAKTQVHFFRVDGSPIGTVKLNAGPLGLAWTPDSNALFVSGDNGEVYRLAPGPAGWRIVHFFFISERREDRAANQKKAPPGRAPFGASAIAPEEPRITTTEQRPEHEGNPQVTGLDVSADGKRLYAGLGMLNRVAVIEVGSDKVITTVPVGVAPYRVVAAPDGKTLYVANRGGRAPQGRETRAFSAGTAVRIDPSTGVALHGSITIIQTDSLSTTEMETGRQPSGLAVSADGTTLYVANADDDAVDLIDTKTRQITQTLSLTPNHDPGFGQMPTDIVVSQDGNWLYVTCGGGNYVAVITLPEFKIVGYVPTGWFPIAIAEQHGTLFVASSKGFGSRLLYPGLGYASHRGIGTVQFIDQRARSDLAQLSHRVAVNNLWNRLEQTARPDAKPIPVPEHAGEPSVFKHVVYIIKENHTYDLDLGDLPQGNGDKALCIFGEKITPNEHALARQFVLLDNTFASGTDSADGHQWTDAAVANAYLEQNYDAYARSYPYAGGDALAMSPAGYIWDAAMRAGKSVRLYGEFADKPQIVDPTTGKTPTWRELWNDYRAGTHKYIIHADSNTAALKTHLDPDYIGFPLLVSDQWRAERFLAELNSFNETGDFPDLSILLLPCDHTAAAHPDMPTPRAYVADNDLALGRIVEGISHSRFWKDTLILVIEDDSGLGLDHVDGHRTVAFCISPYTRRGVAVRDLYNHTSFIRTIGLVLGLPALNRFDRTATPLSACFTTRPDFRPFVHVANRQPLDEMNPPVGALRGQKRKLATASGRLDLSQPDRADPVTLARAAWNEQRPGQPFPWRNFKPDRADAD